MPFRTSREHFEELLEQALESLPEKYTQYFTNITVIVEDYPGSEEAGHVGARREELLGLFTGVPFPHKGGFFDLSPPLPDAIILFQKNIEAICSSERQLIEEIRKTLVHEVGHYFGLSERDLRKYE
ncbi:MAG: metallopeptidase family protein [Nitrospiraceae bacterium]|nr:metallopeptidase family protein [Nitrospiraceae bacterium]